MYNLFYILDVNAVVKTVNTKQNITKTNIMVNLKIIKIIFK